MAGRLERTLLGYIDTRDWNLLFVYFITEFTMFTVSNSNLSNFENYYPSPSIEIRFIAVLPFWRWLCETHFVRYSSSKSLKNTYSSSILKGIFAYFIFLRDGFVWRHDVVTFSILLALCEGIRSTPVNFPHKRPVMPSFGVFCLLAWTSCWTNTQVTGDLKRYDAHVT